MDKLAKLMQDIAILWDKYHPMYLRGMLSTLGLALAATAIGCIIGLACGILNTIPCAKNDPWPKPCRTLPTTPCALITSGPRPS